MRLCWYSITLFGAYDESRQEGLTRCVSMVRQKSCKKAEYCAPDFTKMR